MVSLPFIAAVLCTLMISSICRSVQAAVITGMVLCLLPIIIGQMSSGNLAGWIRCILPTGGLGLGSSFFYELFDFNFLYLGGVSFWIPFVIPVALAVEFRCCRTDYIFITDIWLTRIQEREGSEESIRGIFTDIYGTTAQDVRIL